MPSSTRDAGSENGTTQPRWTSPFYSFVISAYGTPSSSSRTAIEKIAVQFNTHNITEQVRFRDSNIHRLYAALIQHASRMGTLCSAHTLLG